MIRKGDQVWILPEWQDVGDDSYTWIAVTDEEGGRVEIMPSNFEFAFAPVHDVLTTMLRPKADS